MLYDFTGEFYQIFQECISILHNFWLLKWQSGKKKKICLLMQDGEGNGTPLQYSCLENPMDGGA